MDADDLLKAGAHGLRRYVVRPLSWMVRKVRGHGERGRERLTKPGQKKLPPEQAEALAFASLMANFLAAYIDLRRGK